MSYVCFFFNDTATTEIYTLSLHDALPICVAGETYNVCSGRTASASELVDALAAAAGVEVEQSIDPARVRAHEVMEIRGDRKSTRLNSSHANISYAVFCLKKKKSINP